MTGRNVDLIELSASAIRALAASDLQVANLYTPVPLSPYFIHPTMVRVWKRRSEQIARSPADLPWITRAVVDTDLDLAVGRAGFHGPADEAGTIELGYEVDPDFRRRGYARAALEWLLERAREEPSIRVVRATISPDNLASKGLVSQYGFVEVGTQIDDEDGLEIIFEVSPGERRRQPAH